MALPPPMRKNSYTEMMQNSMFGPDDTYIAIMGVTGAGKSTFISRCCAEAGTSVGHSLKSKTQEVQLFTFEFNGTKIHLIDTPGFDDTYRLDSDVLKDLAYWLSISYKVKNIRLSGIVYLHPITHTRMNGTAFKNLRTFRKLIGRDSMSSVVLATTMWANVSHADGNTREAELKSTAEFWGDMIREGSEIYRHMDNYHSAMNIISHLLNKGTTTILGLQKEMVDEKKTLDATEAGREVGRDMIKQREIYERKLLETREEMKEAIAQKDKKLIDQIAKEQEEFQAKIDAAEQGRKDMQIKMEELIKDKEKQHALDMANLDKKIKDQEDYMQKKNQEFEEHRERMKLQQEQDDRKKAAQEAELDAAKVEVEKGNMEKVVYLSTCLLAMEQQKAESEAREQALMQEAQRKEAEMLEERKKMQELYGRQYQNAMWAQQQSSQRQNMEMAAQQQAFWQQNMAQQHMAQQSMAQQNQWAQHMGEVGGAGLGLGAGAVAAAVMGGGCCIM